MGRRQTLHTECTSLRSLSKDDFQFLAEVIISGWGIVPHIFTEVINEKRDFVTLMSTITRTDCPNDLFTPSECWWWYYDSELVSCQDELLQFVHDIDNDISLKYLNPVARLQIRLRQDQ